MKILNIPVFIVSLAIGIFIVYITTGRPDIIHIYPTPDNVKNVQYKDKSGTCFGFTPEEVECPTDSSKIVTYPIQEKKKDKK